MPELYRTLLFILFLSFSAFWVSAKLAPNLLNSGEFKRWRNLWFAVTISAFLCHNIWLFIVVFILLKLVLIPSAPEKSVIYYALLLFALPKLQVEIPSIGIRYLFNITYPRLLVLTLLLLTFNKSKARGKLFTFKSDKWIVMYCILLTVSSLRDNTLTNSLRDTFLLFIDLFVPYFVVSRNLYDLSQINRFLTAFIIGVLPAAFVAIFEAAKFWHLYTELIAVLTGINPKWTYDFRGGALRASSVFHGPIVLAFVMVVSIGILLYLADLIKNKKTIAYIGIGLVGGLLGSVARGPWLACLFMVCAFIWTGPKRFSKLSLIGFSGVVGLGLLALTDKGQRFLEVLPFIGTERSDTIDYRADLLKAGWTVFWHHPWLGSTTFLETPEMEAMRQGQGIIDIVNSYIDIVLSYGIVGLALFLLIFGGMALKCYLLIYRLPRHEIDMIRMSRAFCAIICGIMLTIFTTSSIDYVPVVYWSFAGVVGAFIHLADKTIRESYTVTQSL